MYKVGRKKFFNFKSLFLASFLAIAGIFSAAAIAKEKLVKETPAVEEAEAAGDVYTVIGSMTEWSVSSDTYKLTDSDGDGIYTVNYTCPASSNQFFKIIKNHSYSSGEWGYSNFFIRPTDFTNTWNDNGNVGIWHGSAYNLTIAFRPSTNNIMIFKQGGVPTSWDKTVYLINNWDDWAYPRMHFWNDDYETIWDHKLL